MVPTLLFAFNFDLQQSEKIYREATTFIIIGYIARTVFLFLLGGLITYLHEAETKRISLFLLGISAPSLFAGYISTATQKSDVKASGNPPTIERSARMPNKGLLPFLIPSAYAQSPTQGRSDEAKQYTVPPPSEVSQFLEGLLGISQKRVWFVIAGWDKDQEDAKQGAQEMRGQGFSADVYQSLEGAQKGFQGYDIVIGAQLTKSEADKLASRAIKKKLPAHLVALDNSGHIIIEIPKK
jgi:hypothetical protein